jgi:membrane protein DedA with SNARE-associated domain/membrane-associated phospholipid phosphatase
MEQKFAEWVLPYLTHWGYAALFLLSFLETAAFVGFLIPGETTVVIAGLLAARGVLALDHVIAVVALGAIAGDSVGYFIGRRYGARLFLAGSHRFFFTQRHLDDARGFFARHGGKTVFFGRFVAWLRAFAPLVAGTSRMPYGKFLFFNVYGGIVWATVFSLLGYLIGHGWHLIKGYFSHLGVFAFLLSVMLLYGALLMRHRRHVVRARVGWIDRTLTKRLPIAWDLVKGRFRGGVWYGWNLTLAAVLLLLSVYAFREILEALVQQDALYYLDFEVKRMVTAMTGAPLAQSALRTILQLAPYANALIVGSLATYFAARRDTLELFALFIALGLGAAFFAVLHALMAASAPGLAAKFPSGAAFATVLVYGFLIHAVWRRARGEIVRLLVFTLAPAVVLLIGLADLALTGHWMTDVLGGFVAGIAWLALSLTLAQALRHIVEEQA